MGRTLNRASLPRDASGGVDLTAVDRSLAAIAGSTPPRRAQRVASSVLVERLSSLGEEAPAAPRLNGHAAMEPSLTPPIAALGRETHGPAAPVAPVAVKPASPTDVRGIGRVGPAPVRLEDLEEKLSVAAPSPGPPSDGPVVETSPEEPDVSPKEEEELGSLPPLDPRVSVLPVPSEPASRALPPLTPAPVAAPTPLPLPSPMAEPASMVEPLGVTAPPRSLRSPLSGAPPSRASFGSIPLVAPVRPAPTVAPEEVASVGATFDEFLGSAPVEPTPRSPAPVSVPRIAPAIPTGPHRPPSLQVPAFRPTPAVGVAPVAARSAPSVRPLVSDDEAIEPVEVEVEVEMEEMEEMEEVVAPTLSKAPPPPPLMSRPPAPPPFVPKKR
jgi:hypothetical protein